VWSLITRIRIALWAYGVVGEVFDPRDEVRWVPLVVRPQLRPLPPKEAILAPVRLRTQAICSKPEASHPTQSRFPVYLQTSPCGCKQRAPRPRRYRLAVLRWPSLNRRCGSPLQRRVSPPHPCSWHSLAARASDRSPESGSRRHPSLPSPYRGRSRGSRCGLCTGTGPRSGAQRSARSVPPAITRHQAVEHSHHQQPQTAGVLVTISSSSTSQDITRHHKTSQDITIHHTSRRPSHPQPTVVRLPLLCNF